MTQFQEWYLRQILGKQVSEVHVEGKKPPDAKLDGIIFAITSANFDSSRYSPISLMFRMAAVQTFANQLKAEFGIVTHILAIPHYPSNERFARQIISEIHEQTEGDILITPQNTMVLSSTNTVSEQFRALGYGILPAEACPDYKNMPLNHTPIQIVKAIAESDQAWHDLPFVRAHLHPSTRHTFMQAPWVVTRIKRLWSDPLLNDSGDLTSDRDYQTYAVGMSNPVIIDLKYRELKPFIKEGKIVDEGCADGALLSHIAKDFPDSDLLGVEITGAFYQRCLAAQQAGVFGKSFIHFHQRNILHPLFKDNAIDTTLCNSTFHELWSYVEQEKTLDVYLRLKFNQIHPGGILAARDVVGPANGSQRVLLWCNKTNGINDRSQPKFTLKKDLVSHLKKLSTWAKFLRFAKDYLCEMKKHRRKDAPTIQYTEVTIDGESYFELSLKDATEFMTKMSYVDNWDSEMNEEFAFYTLDDWKRKVTEHGFQVVAELNNEPATREYTSAWIRDNVWKDNVKIFTRDQNDKLMPLQYPVTNMVLVARKPYPSAVTF